MRSRLSLMPRLKTLFPRRTSCIVYNSASSVHPVSLALNMDCFRRERKFHVHRCQLVVFVFPAFLSMYTLTLKLTQISQCLGHNIASLRPISTLLAVLEISCSFRCIWLAMTCSGCNMSQALDVISNVWGAALSMKIAMMRLNKPKVMPTNRKTLVSAIRARSKLCLRLDENMNDESVLPAAEGHMAPPTTLLRFKCRWERNYLHKETGHWYQ